MKMTFYYNKDYKEARGREGERERAKREREMGQEKIEMRKEKSK